MNTLSKRPQFNGALILEDAAARGWNSYKLSRVLNVQPSTVARFVDGETRSVTLAGRIAQELGHPVSRYVLPADAPLPKVAPALRKGRYQRKRVKKGA